MRRVRFLDGLIPENSQNGKTQPAYWKPEQKVCEVDALRFGFPAGK